MVIVRLQVLNMDLFFTKPISKVISEGKISESKLKELHKDVVQRAYEIINRSRSQAVLGRQHLKPTPWISERNGLVWNRCLYDEISFSCT